MYCGCLIYICLDIRYNPCSNGAEFPIEATETGTWSAFVEFNGAWLYQEFEVVDGEDIILNNVFNPSYNHLVRIYDSAGELINEGTCYHVNPVLTLNTTYTPVAPLLGNYSMSFTGETDVQEYTDTELIGAEIYMLAIEGYIYPTGWTFDDTTGTVTIDTPVSEGQIIFILYKK